MEKSSWSPVTRLVPALCLLRWVRKTDKKYLFAFFKQCCGTVTIFAVPVPALVPVSNPAPYLDHSVDSPEPNVYKADTVPWHVCLTIITCIFLPTVTRQEHFLVRWPLASQKCRQNIFFFGVGEREIMFLNRLGSSVADPGSGAFLAPGSGICKKLGSRSGIWDEHPGLYFCIKNIYILWCVTGI